MTILAILALVAGTCYVILAIVVYSRSRHGEEAHGHVVFQFEEPAMLIEGEPTDRRMRKLAAICASTGGRAFTQLLDYSVESITRIDRMIVSGWGERGNEEPSRDIDDHVVLAFGAYVGEVLVRRTKGRWVTGMMPDDPAYVFFISRGNETVSVSPFLLVRRKFTDMYRFDLAMAFTALEQKLRELNVA